MTRPAKPKPQAHEEVARVLRIAQMIDEELRAMYPPTAYFVQPTEPPTILPPGWDILTTAERIAARTEG